MNRMTDDAQGARRTWPPAEPAQRLLSDGRPGGSAVAAVRRASVLLAACGGDDSGGSAGGTSGGDRRWRTEATAP